MNIKSLLLLSALFAISLTLGAMDNNNNNKLPTEYMDYQYQNRHQLILPQLKLLKATLVQEGKQKKVFVIDNLINRKKAQQKPKPLNLKPTQLFK